MGKANPSSFTCTIAVTASSGVPVSAIPLTPHKTFILPSKGRSQRKLESVSRQFSVRLFDENKNDELKQTISGFERNCGGQMGSLIIEHNLVNCEDALSLNFL